MGWCLNPSSRPRRVALALGWIGGLAIAGEAASPATRWTDLFLADGTARVEREVMTGAGAASDLITITDQTGERDDLWSADQIGTGAVAPEHDLRRAYAYTTEDADGNLVLHAGSDRLAEGDSYLEFDFRQELIRIGHGGFGLGQPWQLVDRPSTDDLRVRIEFAAGGIERVVAERLGPAGFETVAALAQAGCDQASVLCVEYGSAALSDREDQDGTRVVDLAVNVGTLLHRNPSFASISVKTPADIAIGHFGWRG